MESLHKFMGWSHDAPPHIVKVVLETKHLMFNATARNSGIDRVSSNVFKS